MSLFDDLFEAASNVVSAAATVAKSMPERIESFSNRLVHETILDRAKLYKSINRPNMAPDWYYMERAKKDVVSTYRIPCRLQEEYRRYDRVFQERYSVVMNPDRWHEELFKGRNR
ncbi:MAG: hypothetical protein IJ523_10200 [Succinivibrionaceae bacterium]|nr:hypothetical protein [Succinivibrionaceae bacterium]